LLYILKDRLKLKGENVKTLVNLKFLITAMAIVVICTMPFKARAQSVGLPAPNLSEMEKDYEIVKWTYTDDGYIKLVVKPKTEPPHTHNIGFKFFDEDGVAVAGPNMILNLGFSTPVGTVERGEAGLPDPSKFKKIKSVVLYWVQNDGSLIGPKPFEPSTNNSTTNNSGTNNTAPAKKQLLTTKNDAADSKQSGGCDYSAQPALGSAGKFSVALAKSGIYERYGFEKDIGGISSPADVGVTFLNVQLLNSYTNTVTVVPGRGAQRKHDGAPPNAMIYRFHAKYIVCRKYSNTTVRTQYESDNVCFKEANGNWHCPVDSVPEITELN
jgi:hypothetical protein